MAIYLEFEGKTVTDESARPQADASLTAQGLDGLLANLGKQSFTLIVPVREVVGRGYNLVLIPGPAGSEETAKRFAAPENVLETLIERFVGEKFQEPVRGLVRVGQKHGGSLQLRINEGSSTARTLLLDDWP